MHFYPSLPLNLSEVPDFLHVKNSDSCPLPRVCWELISAYLLCVIMRTFPLAQKGGQRAENNDKELHMGSSISNAERNLTIMSFFL